MTNRVFVYGTLKRRCPNNALLEGSEFLGDSVTAPTYKMVTCKMVETSFPVIMPHPGGGRDLRRRRRHAGAARPVGARGALV